jgi:hypothetical protein
LFDPAPLPINQIACFTVLIKGIPNGFPYRIASYIHARGMLQEQRKTFIKSEAQFVSLNLQQIQKQQKFDYKIEI